MKPKREQAGPTRGETGNLRDRLIEKGLELLASGKEVTLRRVADAVGVSQTAPYVHFGKESEGGGLDALLEAIAVEGFDRLRHAMRRSARANETCALAALGKAYVRFALENRKLFDLMFSPRLVQNLNRKELVMARGEGQAVIEHVIGECQRLRAIRAGDPRELTKYAWATLHGIARLVLDDQLSLMDPAIEQHADDLIDQAVEIFLHGVAPR